MRTILAIVVFLAAFAVPANSEPKFRDGTSRLNSAPVELRKPLIGRVVDEVKATVNPQGATADGDTNAGTLRKRLLQVLAKPFQDITDLIGDDVDNAIILATAIPNLKDGHGQQCWIALRDFTDVAKAHPLPLTAQIATDLQAIRLQAIAANRLCSNIHCTQMFTDYSSMAQAVASAAVGAIGSLGARALPSLSDACAKIPQIALVDPVDPVPPPAEIKPVGDFLQPETPKP